MPLHASMKSFWIPARFLLVAAVLFVFVFGGSCGQSGPRVVKVSGVVLVDGQPLELPAGVQAFVQFVPAGARPASGEIDPQTGRFTLTTMRPGDGCVTGQHKVAVIIRANVGTESISLVDEKYSRPEASGITVTIDGPNDNVQINIQGPLKQLPPGALQPVSQEPNIM